ncbi:MAG TPA: ricin-type beta-trefoil lectin domain protein [Trebonia sp.]|nr:ricin-type beta-trefoil lectin domain protein [Trebonia sp.]
MISLPGGPGRPWIIGVAAVVAVCLLAAIARAVTSSDPSSPALPVGVQPSSATMADAGPVPPVPAGYTQVFLDNFGGVKGSPPSALNWLYDIGTNWGNNQVEQDTNSTRNVYLDGQGDLIIQANRANGKWTSGRIETARGDFTAPPGGKLEMTASVEQPSVPDATGYWPAFWALGSPLRTGGQWPRVGELDMFEDVNGMNEASQTLHDGGPTVSHPQIPCPVTSCDGGFNTYSVIIDRANTSAESVEFLMDGRVEKTITEAQVGTSAWQAAIDHGFYLLLDLAMGGTYPNGKCHCASPTAGTTPGGQMKVAYVAVYEQGGNSTPPARATATGQVAGFQGNCLGNLDSRNSYPNPTVLSGCDHSDGQAWSTYSDGTLRAQGGCLDVAQGARSPGTAAVWYPCTAGKSQVWQPKSGGELLNPYSGLCLTSPAPSAPLDLEPCRDTPGQRWHLPA